MQEDWWISFIQTSERFWWSSPQDPIKDT